MTFKCIFLITIIAVLSSGCATAKLLDVGKRQDRGQAYDPIEVSDDALLIRYKTEVYSGQGPRVEEGVRRSAIVKRKDIKWQASGENLGYFGVVRWHAKAATDSLPGEARTAVVPVKKSAWSPHGPRVSPSDIGYPFSAFDTPGVLILMRKTEDGEDYEWAMLSPDQESWGEWWAYPLWIIGAPVAFVVDLVTAPVQLYVITNSRW